MGATTTARTDGPAPSPAGVLRGTGFGRLWGSTASANLADGLVLAGLPVLATTVTRSPAAIAGVTVALMLPMVLAALPAGAIADRSDRRRLLIAGNAGRASVLVVLLALVAAVDLHLATIYAIAVAASSSEVLVDTAAQTAVPGLVPDARLDGANARLMVTQMVGNHAVGAPIGAALAAIGAVALLGPTIVLYVVAALAATRLRLPSVRRADPDADTGAPGGARLGAPTGMVPQLRREVGDGIRHLVASPVLRRLALANAASNLGNTAFVAVLVVFVVDRLGLPAASYGALLAAVAVGGLLGGAVAERVLRRTGPAIGLRAGFAVTAVCYGAVTLSRGAALFAGLVAVLGAASMIVNVCARTLRQRLVPGPFLGRVTASMAAVALVATPLGAASGGLLAEWIGVTAVGWFAAGANLAAVVVLGRLRGPELSAGGRSVGDDGGATGHPAAPRSTAVDIKLELVIVPVTDVDRAKTFYADQVGFVVDHDHVVSDEVRFVQLTPPGSACSIAIGRGLTDATPGSLRGLQAVVEDVRKVREELVGRGVEVTEVDVQPWGDFVDFADPDGNRWILQQLPARS